MLEAVAVTPSRQDGAMRFDELLPEGQGPDRPARPRARARRAGAAAKRDARRTVGRETPPASPAQPAQPAQLTLIEGAPAGRRDWVLDPHTRRVGRLGVAAARAALARATPPGERGTHAA
jgi:hypothetical protein